jgi:hypothetical protein
MRPEVSMKRLRSGRRVVVAICAVACSASGGLVFAQPGQAGRPSLLFKEEWRIPKHEGPATDENTRFSSDVVTNDRIEAKLYGPGSVPVRAAEHEGRVDLWNGLATSPVAVTLRDKRNFVDLTGLARLRWIVRTNAIHTLYPVVKLPDGTLAVTTDGDFLAVEIAFTGMKWFKLDPQKIVVMTEVKSPDLSKVDEVGLASLAPGGGHGIAGSFNLSTVELFAKGIPR